MYRWLFVVVLGLIATSVVGTTTRPPELEQVVSAATAVARVRILRAEANTLSAAEQGICGFDYLAEVTETIKGSLPGRLAFVSSSSLAVGLEYLVFLSRMQGQAEAHNSKGSASGGEDEKCDKSLEREWRGGYALQFDDQTRDSGGRALWLVMSSESPRLPEDVKTRKVHCESDDVRLCEVVEERVLVEWSSLLTSLKR